MLLLLCGGKFQSEFLQIVDIDFFRKKEARKDERKEGRKDGRKEGKKESLRIYVFIFYFLLIYSLFTACPITISNRTCLA